MTSFDNIATATARKSLLNGLIGTGARCYRKGMTLAATKAMVVERGLATADDMIAMGAVNEGWQQERTDSINEGA